MQDYNSPLKGGVYTLRTASGTAAGPATPTQPGRMAGQGQAQPPGDALVLPGPFGDLFQPHDIAAGQAAPATPSWPRWNLTRPFLNGDFLLQVLTALPMPGMGSDNKFAPASGWAGRKCKVSTHFTSLLLTNIMP